ncbi:hypothetical protein BJV82DRAFT_594195 [Fennellomyces sp. T-0311]|nr:hypothetical protein BJV82DRAFT_594195 [Fennellomyces sp. T-0311]
MDSAHPDNARLIKLLSVDIMYMILKKLSSRSLLRCAITCKEWCEMLLSWPHFWETLHNELEVTPSQHQTISNILRHQEEVHCITMASSSLFAEQHWLLLVEMRQADITVLDITQMVFRNQRGIKDALEASGPNLKKLILNNCESVPISELIAGTWLEPCTQLEQLSIPKLWPWSNSIDPISPSHISTSTLRLIHLQLSAGPGSVHLIPHILRRCPNLECLAIDADDPIDDHGSILSTAYNACPKLQWISMVPCASSRVPFFEDILDGEDYSDDGLYGLFLGGRQLTLENPSDLYPLLKKSHSTLRVLHLVYDGTPIFWHTLYHLGQLGVPKLRELSLNSLDGCGFHSNRCATQFEYEGKTFSFEQIFMHVVKRAPALQIAHFDGSGGNLPPELGLTEACFIELGKKQHRSKLKRLYAINCCQINSLRGFCQMPSARLEHLSCDCGSLTGEDLRHLLKKAKNLYEFETLHILSSELYDPDFDRMTMTFRLRSFFNGATGCDCTKYGSFSSQDRAYGKEILSQRYGRYLNGTMPDMVACVDTE